MITRLRNKIRTDVDFSDLLKGGALSFFIKIFGFGATYIFTMVVTWQYGSTGWGTFSLCLSALQLFGIVGRLGTDRSILRFVSQNAALGKWSELKGIYVRSNFIVIFFTTLICIVMYMSAGVISEMVFGKPQLEGYLRIISLGILPLNLMYFNAEAIRGIKGVVDYTFLKHGAISVFSIVFVFLFYALFKGTAVAFYAYLAAIVMAFIYSQIVFLNRSKLTQHKSVFDLSYKQILTVSLPMLFSNWLIFLMGWTDTIMLGIFRTESEVGIYNVGLKLASLTSFALMAVNAVSAPRFAELFSTGQIDRLKKMVMNSTRLIFWTSVPVLLLLATMPGFFMSLFGPEFKSGSWVLLFLVLGQFVNAISGSVGYLLQMTGHEKTMQNIVLSAAVINIILNYFFIRRYGMEGAAVATMISMAYWNLLSVYVIRKKLGIMTLYLPGFDKFFRR